MNKLEFQSNIDNPKELEKMYRENKTAFKSEFQQLYPELKERKLAEYWNERLNYENSEISWGSSKELRFVFIACLIAGIIAQFPKLFNLIPDLFYQRNVGFIVLPILTSYFIWKRNLSTKKIGFVIIATLIALFAINLFPENLKSDTLVLSSIHLPLILWSILGFAYVGENYSDYSKRFDFLRYNGDLVIMCALLMISGAILTGITIGLFSVIGLNIEHFYFEYIAVFAIPSIPILATYITQTNPQLVNKISPVIAKIFSPIVLVMLSVFLVAFFVSGKSPYNDREFLLVFNLLLIGVMAIILFSITGTIKKSGLQTNSIILLALSIVTIIVNGIALSAIVFRISEWGITPNRLAVFGGNIIILTNLFIVSFKLFKNVSKKSEITEVEHSISLFLPIYTIWAVIVTFIFPLIFNFR